MKSIKAFFIMALTCLFVISSCELVEEETPKPDCRGKGYLTQTNGSLHTIQQIIIDGTNYGSLDPGDTETFTLAAGRHEVRVVGVNGGGCSPTTVTIVECETEGRICRN